jgi:multimeric flavodoxin WrbA
MNVIAFLGSPRAEGNSDVLLSETLKAVGPAEHAVRVFRLNEMDMRPCQNCGGCDSSGRCVIEDDMQEVHRAIREADRIIIASPIFFLGLSAQTKIMIDRCQCLWYEKYLLKRPIPEGPFGRKGLLLLVGGMAKDIGAQCGDATARAFFRSISVATHETLSYLGIDEKGAIYRHPTALSDAFQAGVRLTSP